MRRTILLSRSTDAPTASLWTAMVAAVQWVPSPEGTKAALTWTVPSGPNSSSAHTSVGFPDGDALMWVQRSVAEPRLMTLPSEAGLTPESPAKPVRTGVVATFPMETDASCGSWHHRHPFGTVENGGPVPSQRSHGGQVGGHRRWRRSARRLAGSLRAKTPWTVRSVRHDA